MILSSRVIHPARIAFIFHAELTLRISALRRILCRSNGLRVLFRLGQVDGDINLSVRAVHFPADIFLYPVPTDIIVILTELIESIRSLLRILAIYIFKFFNDFRWRRRQNTHELCIEQISRDDIIAVDDSTLKGNICQSVKYSRQRDLLTGDLLLLVFILFKYLQKLIDGISCICRHHKSCLQSVFYQFRNFSV